MPDAIKIPKEAKTIRSVSEAIDALSNDSLMSGLRPPQSAKRGDKDFGLWFRGHERWDHVLVPSLLRESISQSKRYVDEFSLTRHFKAMNPDACRPEATDFEWLVTMQHYLAPTRLLDWTENLLVALYFAVRAAYLDNQVDGAIWILNARGLNYYASASSRAHELAFPEDPDVIARSCLSRVRERQEWHDVFVRELARIRSDRQQSRQNLIADAIKRIQLKGKAVNDLNSPLLDLTRYSDTQGTQTPVNLFERPVGKTVEGIYARLRMPIAVYASKSNRRIRTQSGVFTLHGGKYVPTPQDFDEPEEHHSSPIGMPIGLMEINDSLSRKAILKWLRIPKKCRSSIRRTLAQIGVTDATLFPELDYQSKYLLTRWTFVEKRGEDDE